MIWYPPQLYKGATVAVIGGGSSLSAEQVRKVRNAGLRTIGVNDAYRFGTDIDVCFFGDAQWWYGNEKHQGHALRCSAWYGLRVTCAPGCTELPGVHALLPRIDKGLWPAPCCKWYRNSGLSAVGLAVTLGASGVLLLGFDGQAINGKTHWHGFPVETPDQRVFNEHVKSAYELLDDIREYPGGKSVTVWNASPDSVYPFPQTDLDSFLEGYRL